MKAGLVALLGAATAVGAAEWLHRRAFRLVGPAVDQPDSEAIVVLGYPSRRNGRMHPVQRWRTRVAVRSVDAHCAHHRLIFTGAARPGEGPRASEAAVMAAYARDRFDLPADWLLLETEARNTRENVCNVLPLIGAAQVVKIASDPMHAARAAAYLAGAAPEVAARLVRVDNYRLGRDWWIKVPTAAYELALAARHRLGGEARPMGCGAQ